MEHENIWYFAFGSNMNPKTLTGHRKVSPIQSIPAYLHGWYLNFEAIGIPYWEPCYASIGLTQMQADQPEVHGVLHQITRKNYDQIRNTELGGGYDNTGFYESVQVIVQTYDGKEISAWTLVCPKSIFLRGKFLPSKRYMDLIRGGAKEFGLTDLYQQWLQTLPHYEPHTNFWNVVGRKLFLSNLKIFYFPLLYPYMKTSPGRAPRWIFVLCRWFILALAHIYHYIFLPVFGPGAGET